MFTAQGVQDGRHQAYVSAPLQGKLAAGFATADVIVSGAPERLVAVADAHGARVKKRLARAVVLTVTPDTLRSLTTEASVVAITSDDTVVPTMAVTSVATGTDQVWAGIEGLPGVTGRGVRVAVVDSGIVDRHPALRKRVPLHVDFTDGNGRDEYGHGTHVAGIVAGAGVHLRGVAPDAELLSLRVLDEEGKASTSTVIEAIDWATAHKEELDIGVLTLAIGKPANSSWRFDPLAEAAQRAVEAGLVVVASAGNLGQSPQGYSVLGGITSPGSAPDVITVGAVDTLATPEREDDVVPAWSSKGPSYLDGFLKPDLVAPGSQILSLTAAGTTLAEELPDAVSPDKHRLTLSGTSQATAVVAGAAALLLEIKPELTPADIKYVLQSSASFMPEHGVFLSGAGELNVAAAALTSQEGSSAPELSTTVAGQEVHASGYAWQASPDGSFGFVYPPFGSAQLLAQNEVLADEWTWAAAFMVGDNWTWGNTWVWGSAMTMGDNWTWGNNLRSDNSSTKHTKSVR